MFFPTSRTLSDGSDLDLRTDRVYNQTNVPIIRYQDYNLIRPFTYCIETVYRNENVVK